MPKEQIIQVQEEQEAGELEDESPDPGKVQQVRRIDDAPQGMQELWVL